MWARGHTCTSVIVGRSGCGAKILLSHHHAFLFCYLLLVQSDRVVFSPDVGFCFVWRRRSRERRFHSGSNSGWSLQLYMTLASLPQFIRHLGKLSLKRQFWCAPRRRGFWEHDVQSCCFLYSSQAKYTRFIKIKFEAIS